MLVASSSHRTPRQCNPWWMVPPEPIGRVAAHKLDSVIISVSVGFASMVGSPCMSAPQIAAHLEVSPNLPESIFSTIHLKLESTINSGWYVHLYASMRDRREDDIAHHPKCTNVPFLGALPVCCFKCT